MNDRSVISRIEKRDVYVSALAELYSGYGWPVGDSGAYPEGSVPRIAFWRSEAARPSYRLSIGNPVSNDPRLLTFQQACIWRFGDIARLARPVDRKPDAERDQLHHRAAGNTCFG